MAMTLKQAKATCREYGCTFRKTDCGEYRVNLIGGTEAQAAYTDDLDDAIGTAKLMAEWKAKQS